MGPSSGPIAIPLKNERHAHDGLVACGNAHALCAGTAIEGRASESKTGSLAFPAGESKACLVAGPVRESKTGGVVFSVGGSEARILALPSCESKIRSIAHPANEAGTNAVAVRFAESKASLVAIAGAFLRS